MTVRQPKIQELRRQAVTVQQLGSTHANRSQHLIDVLFLGCQETTCCKHPQILLVNTRHREHVQWAQDVVHLGWWRICPIWTKIIKGKNSGMFKVAGVKIETCGNCGKRPDPWLEEGHIQQSHGVNTTQITNTILSTPWVPSSNNAFIQSGAVSKWWDRLKLKLD